MYDGPANKPLFSYFNPDWRNYPPTTVNQIERALALEDAVFGQGSRHLVLFVTLTYKAHVRHLKTLDDIAADRDRLFANRRSNQLLSGIRDYVWRIEEVNRPGFPGGSLV